MTAPPDMLKLVHDTVVVLARFFGQMSPFDIIVAIIALANGIYTAYISFFQRARVRLYLGNQVGIVFNPDDVGRKLHLRCNFVNSAVKMGTVHHLEVAVHGPQNFDSRFRWHLFYEYAKGGVDVEKSTDVYPLAVAGRDAHVEFIEFDVVGLQQGQRPSWVPGRYAVAVEGWVNKRDRGESPNLHAVCHITLPEREARQLREVNPAQSVFLAFPVVEWATPKG